MCVCTRAESPLSLPQANIRAQQRTTFRQITEKKTSVKKVERVEGTAYNDGRVKVGVAARGKKQLKFNEPGESGTVEPQLSEP